MDRIYRIYVNQGLKCNFIFPADYRRKMPQIFADRGKTSRIHRVILSHFAGKYKIM